MHSYIQRPSIICLVIVLSFSSCKKDEDDTPITGNGNGNSGVITAHGYLSGVLIEANFRGLIRDENDQPISDVEVSIGTMSTFTDADGIWQLINVMVDSERAYIRAEKAGYFHGSRVLTPTDIGFNRAFITLMTAQAVGSVSSSTGGEVTHSSGSMVSLPADGYVDENGNAYSGMVDVQMTYLDPSDLDILEQMPGNLSALDAEEDFVALITYGMIGVELVGSGGESLQLAPGAAAEITLPVPPEGMASAPATIPLWHFDEEEGVWKEDGSASLIGNEYVGTVSHFSFWNCDIPTDFVFLNGYAQIEGSGLPIQGVQVTIISQNFGNGVAYSSQNGYYGGIIPANEVLIMEVYSPCGILMSSQEIGPFGGDITVPVTIFFEEDIGIITGFLEQCSGQPGLGYLTASGGTYFDETIEVYEDGTFFLVSGCPPQTVELIAYSPDLLSSSGSVVVTTVPGETVDAGTLDLCGQDTDEYISLTVEGVTYTNVDTVAAEGNGSQLSIYSSGPDAFITFLIDDSEFPDIDNVGGQSNYFSTLIDGQLYYGWIENFNPELYFTFSSYSTISGDYLEFEFVGVYQMWTNNVPAYEDISGSGRVRRE